MVARGTTLDCRSLAKIFAEQSEIGRGSYGDVHLCGDAFGDVETDCVIKAVHGLEFGNAFRGKSFETHLSEKDRQLLMDTDGYKDNIGIPELEVMVMKHIKRELIDPKVCTTFVKILGNSEKCKPAQSSFLELLEYDEDLDPQDGYTIFITMEKYDGNLDNFLDTFPEFARDEKKMIGVLITLQDALCHLKRIGVYHADFHAGNIFYKVLSDKSIQWAIGDFGYVLFTGKQGKEYRPLVAEDFSLDCGSKIWDKRVTFPNSHLLSVLTYFNKSPNAQVLKDLLLPIEMMSPEDALAHLRNL
jgi:serine/threonine protein kinase